MLAAHLLSVAIVCAGCVGPIGDWIPYADPASECGCSDVCECDQACQVGPTGRAVNLAKDGCQMTCKVCGHVVNCYAPHDAIGPPEIPPPGRFHPVPTHPVFARGAEPLAHPGDF